MKSINDNKKCLNHISELDIFLLGINFLIVFALNFQPNFMRVMLLFHLGDFQHYPLMVPQKYVSPCNVDHH